MGDFSSFGKLLIFMGGLLALTGVIVLLAGKISGLGRLPGDFYINRGNFTFYFPLATSIIVSLLLTLVLNLFFRR